MTKRENMRWFCPECKRTDPRHPNTLAKDLPKVHSCGFYSCWGVRIPQVFNEETRKWQNENTN